MRPRAKELHQERGFSLLALHHDKLPTTTNQLSLIQIVNEKYIMRKDTDTASFLIGFTKKAMLVLLPHAVVPFLAPSKKHNMANCESISTKTQPLDKKLGHTLLHGSGCQRNNEIVLPLTEQAVCTQVNTKKKKKNLRSHDQEEAQKLGIGTGRDVQRGLGVRSTTSGQNITYRRRWADRPEGLPRQQRSVWELDRWTFRRSAGTSPMRTFFAKTFEGGAAVRSLRDDLQEGIPQLPVCSPVYIPCEELPDADDCRKDSEPCFPEYTLSLIRADGYWCRVADADDCRKESDRTPPGKACSTASTLKYTSICPCMGADGYWYVSETFFSDATCNKQTAVDRARRQKSSDSQSWRIQQCYPCTDRMSRDIRFLVGRELHYPFCCKVNAPYTDCRNLSDMLAKLRSHVGHIH
ncbi:hypothetical protein OBBRIDRAFT_808822 [Obba rivulosa]|uniref:Uncharacterized protein n=1 Tax=Obba rivulosa TaxID=1052685 RepID=A0A8E2AFT9_9APHY|nr:hypothetical protein OBBRIDRAFT_808822 [Obba rivulosa]